MLVDEVTEIRPFLSPVVIDKYILEVVFVQGLLLEIGGFVICDCVESEVESDIDEVGNVGSDIEDVFGFVAVYATSICLLERASLLDV